MDRRTFVSGVISLPFAFLFKKTEASTIIKENTCVEEPKVEESVCVKDKYGTKRWYQNGELHRLDGPAVEWANGGKRWYQNGKLHRLDGPAVEDVDGDKYWYQNGKLHRLDGPAVEYASGSKYWFQNGKYVKSNF